MDTTATPPGSDVQTRLEALRLNLSDVIQGKPDSIDALIVAFLAGGSVLLEDVPGVGKTTLAKALARSVTGVFRRVQFTPDLLPTDILGASIYSPKDSTFHFRPGPVFCNVLLADEINRASPRTQSALLEAMSEKQATIEGERRKLPDPFLVLATQNPIDFQGTYPLPEAQLDRFLIHLNLGYPDADTEVEILLAQADEIPVDAVQPVLTVEEVTRLQSQVRQVAVERTVAGYLVEIVQRTRVHDDLRLGVSPRGSLMLLRAAQSAALLQGRDYVCPDDVQRMAGFVLPHRVVLTSKAKYRNLVKDEVISHVVDQVRVPV